MSAVAVSSFGDPLFGLLVLVAVGLVLYLSGDAFRQMRAQRRQQRLRQEQRQRFWGYE